jgi:hypothetical protein
MKPAAPGESSDPSRRRAARWQFGAMAILGLAAVAGAVTCGRYFAAQRAFESFRLGQDESTLREALGSPRLIEPAERLRRFQASSCELLGGTVGSEPVEHVLVWTNLDFLAAAGVTESGIVVAKCSVVM